MNKFKRPLAIAGIILLAALYLTTLICAITDSTDTGRLFFASVVATVIIPALLWTYSFIYRLMKNNRSNKEERP